MASIGVPGLNGFVSEFLVLSGTFITHRWWAVVAVLGVIVAAIYLLWAYQQVFHGTPREADDKTRDLVWLERLVMAPLIILIVFLGVYPKPVLDRINPSVNQLIAHVETVTGHHQPPVATKGVDGHQVIAAQPGHHARRGGLGHARGPVDPVPGHPAPIIMIGGAVVPARPGLAGARPLRVARRHDRHVIISGGSLASRCGSGPTSRTRASHLHRQCRRHGRVQRLDHHPGRHRHAAHRARGRRLPAPRGRARERSSTSWPWCPPRAPWSWAWPTT